MNCQCGNKCVGRCTTCEIFICPDCKIDDLCLDCDSDFSKIEVEIPFVPFPRYGGFSGINAKHNLILAKASDNLIEDNEDEKDKD